MYIFFKIKKIPQGMLIRSVDLPFFVDHSRSDGSIKSALQKKKKKKKKKKSCLLKGQRVAYTVQQQQQKAPENNVLIFD
jgi:hypothetical protein